MFSKPLAQLAPSFLVFNQKNTLIYWSIRAQDDCEAFEKLLAPGLTVEELTEKAIQAGILDTEGASTASYINKRLKKFRTGKSAFQCRMAGNRWFQFSDKRGEDHTTLTTMVNVTAVERREKALAMLVGEKVDGLSVLERAARALSIGLGMATTSIARLLPGQETVETVAFWQKNELGQEQKFPIAGTPCEPVYREGYYTITGNFLEPFPDIQKFDCYYSGICSGTYAGQVVYNATGQAIGHIIAIDEGEHHLDEADRRLILLVAEHVGFEIERLAARAALLESEDRFKDFAEAASDLFFETNAQLQCCYVSDRAEAMTGTKASDWIGRSIADLGPKDDSAWQNYLQDLADRRPFRDVFVMFRNLQGKTGNFSLNGKPVFDEAKNFIGYRLTAREMTNNIKAQGRAREAELRVRQVLEGSLEGFALYDADHRLVLCNQKFLHLLFPGQEEKVVRGMSIDQLADLWIGRGAAREKRRVIKFHLEPDTLGRDYQDITLPGRGTLRIIRRRTEEGGVATIYLDITDLKLREQELSAAKELAEIANKTKSEFLANVSHELRTPLNAIIGFSEIMREQFMGPIENSRYRQYIEDIHSSGEHLLDMINDILDLSKAEAGRLELYEEIVDVSEIVTSVIRLMRERAEKVHLGLSVSIDTDLPFLRGDSRRIKQILLNLVSNSIKFTPAHGNIQVITGQKNGALVITVNDTGIGISLDEIPRVLSPFGQIDSPLARNHQGTGLGLPLTKRLVELHEGSLSITSEIGKGTQITALFPAERVVLEEKAA